MKLDASPRSRNKQREMSRETLAKSVHSVPCPSVVNMASPVVASKDLWKTSPRFSISETMASSMTSVTTSLIDMAVKTSSAIAIGPRIPLIGTVT